MDFTGTTAAKAPLLNLGAAIKSRRASFKKGKIMKEVTAYKSNAGNLHADIKQCVAEDIAAFSKPAGTSTEQICITQALALVRHRKEVIRLLNSIDDWLNQAEPMT